MSGALKYDRYQMTLSLNLSDTTKDMANMQVGPVNNVLTKKKTIIVILVYFLFNNILFSESMINIANQTWNVHWLSPFTNM